MRFMALRTWNIDMFSVEPEGCFIVIKPGSLPVLRTMAVFAVGCTVLLKLPIMIINMAAGTVDR